MLSQITCINDFVRHLHSGIGKDGHTMIMMVQFLVRPLELFLNKGCKGFVKRPKLR